MILLYLLKLNIQIIISTSRKFEVFKYIYQYLSLTESNANKIMDVNNRQSQAILDLL